MKVLAQVLAPFTSASPPWSSVDSVQQAGLRPLRFASLTTLVGSLVLLAVACVPKRDLPPDQIEKLRSLDDVMDVQATVSDPQFGKIGASSLSEQDWAALGDMATRLRVTSKKSKEFSKGPEFDAFADRLGTKADALGTAVAAKDISAVSASLTEVKATCKGCHSKFR